MLVSNSKTRERDLNKNIKLNTEKSKSNLLLYLLGMHACTQPDNLLCIGSKV